MNNKELRDIIFSDKYEKCTVETNVLGGIIIPYILMNEYRVFLYGVKDAMAIPYIKYLKSNEVIVDGIIDDDITQAGKTILGCRYIHTSELFQIEQKEKVFVVIITGHYESLSGYGISNLLYNAGIDKYYHIMSDDLSQIHPPIPIDPRVEGLFRNNVDVLEFAYSNLADDESKEIMKEYMRVLCLHHIYNIPECDGRRKYLWGGTRKEKREELYRHLSEEVWLNCGANIGDSIFLYASQGLEAKKIYAFEGDEGIYKKLCANIAMLPENYRDIVEPVNAYIDNDTDFDEYLKFPVTLVNADIEGAELSLLKSIQDIIIRDRPVIAVCMYHRMDDFVEIPRFILSIVKDYKLLIRKYESDMAGDVAGFWEMVLYAIPPERYIFNEG